MTSVAVAVTGLVGDLRGGNGSRRAVRWAVENLMAKAGRFILVHVMPAINSIPSPSGDRIPVEELDGKVVALYVEDVKEQFEQLFSLFKKICKTKQMETLILEDDNPADALKRYISESGINSLVLGSCSSNFITRKLKGPGVPTAVLKCAPSSCDVYVVSKDRIITRFAKPFLVTETSSRVELLIQGACREGSTGTDKHKFEFSTSYDEQKSESFTSYDEFAVERANPSYSTSDRVSNMVSFSNSTVNETRNPRNFAVNMVTPAVTQLESTTPTMSRQPSDVVTEVEQLSLELQNTVAMYKQVCEELVHTQNEVLLLSSKCHEEARKVAAAVGREENLRKVAAEDKAKHLQAMKEVEEAKVLLARESYEKKIARLNALKESLQKQILIDELFLRKRRHRRYTKEEIEVATDFFSQNNVIGEGGYGKVYKCNLDHTPVAIKVICSDALEKKEEFLTEVEVLGQLCHPHIVLLLGACAESGCLVYEYLENGSLEDYIFRQNGKPSLPWFVKFRIIFEVACALAFLHNSKPKPIVHRDLKPGNILLDRNFTSKIGDVGLAKLISEATPDNITEYRDSILSGTLYYMDPEYQRTGTVRPKSDLYALGVIILQLLTSRHPNGLILTVENAINHGYFPDILYRSSDDWPLAETEELAQIALKCSKLRCRDRPDLNTEVLPVLRRLVDMGNASVKVGRKSICSPSDYVCPILQEIMDDPCLAADGFTYERRAITAWLEKHDVSPVTKVQFQHSFLTPNHTLRSAIQEWRS